MCKMSVTASTLVILFVYCALADPVSFINKCKWDDETCIKESAQAAIPYLSPGIPEMGVQSLDPMFLSKIDATIKGLKFIVYNATVTGLKQCAVKKMQRDVPKSKLLVKLLCDASLDGLYEIDGQLLILPIKGTGPIHVKLHKIFLSADLDMSEKTGKDDSKHWEVKSYKHSFELKDKADVVFENLFEGNEALGRAARQLLSSSANDIVTEIGPPLIKAVVGKVIVNVNRFFNKVPVEDLALN